MSASMKTHENFEGQKKNVAKVITPRVHTLGKQGKQKKNENSKKSSHKKKKFLKTPFKYEWSTITEALNKEVLAILGATFEKEGLSKPLCKRGGRKVQEKQKSVEKPEQEPTTEAEKKRRDNWKHLMFGVNAVTRSLEKRDTSLVLVDSGAQPPIITKHLVELCMINRVPGAQIQQLSSIADVVGLRSVTCMAFKPLDQIDNAGLKDMITTLIDKVPRIKGPLEPDSIPPLDLSQDSEEDVTGSDPFPTINKPTLPPDDLTFSSLYVYKDDEHDFASQDDFISLSTTFKRKGEKPEKSMSGGKSLRYMDTAIGTLKYDPDKKKNKMKH